MESYVYYRQGGSGAFRPKQGSQPFHHPAQHKTPLSVVPCRARPRALALTLQLGLTSLRLEVVLLVPE